MGAYNCINGEPACASETYLKKRLYGDFGFDGYVVSDCGAICDINSHHKITQNEAESAALAINNGCQLNCGDAYKWIKTAVASELLTEETITEAVERLFEARFRLGMFDEECVYNHIPYNVVESEKHTLLNRKMAQESIVLLKNDGILPLNSNMTIAVIGPNADDKQVLLGNYHGTPSSYTTFLQGIQETAQTQVYHAKGCHIIKDEISAWEEHPMREAILAVKRSDVVVMIMGLNPSIEGEEGDAYNGISSGDKRDIELPLSQQKLYDEVLNIGKPIVFINVSGSCVSLVKQDKTSNAVVQCFYPGAEGGSALADILFGSVSPSGRLPVTFYRTTDDLPDFNEYSMENRTYRFFKGSSLYEFGFGLSYTQIEYGPLIVDENKVMVKVKNIGKMAGQEAVQVYQYYPDQLDKPVRQLVAFKKVHLDIGEEKTVSFEVEDNKNLFIRGYKLCN